MTNEVLCGICGHPIDADEMVVYVAAARVHTRCVTGEAPDRWDDVESAGQTVDFATPRTARHVAQRPVLPLAEMTRQQLDDAMREVMLQLLMCSHVPAGPYDPIGRSRDAKEQSGARPPGDLGAESWLAEEYDRCETDDQRRETIRKAREELKDVRKGPDERPAEIEMDADDWLETRNKEIVAQGEGLTIDEAAIKFRCGPRDIVKARRADGRETDRGLKPEFEGGRERGDGGRFEADEAKRARVIELDGEGYRISQIAMLTGLSRSTVERYLGRRAA